MTVVFNDNSLREAPLHGHSPQANLALLLS
jgi:hypothetical protein